MSVTMYVMDFMVLIAQMTFGDRERILYGLDHGHDVYHYPG